MPFCRKCGTEYNEADVYCNKCGNKVDAPPDAVRPEQSSPLRVNNTIVWIIAFMPLIGLIASNIIPGLSGGLYFVVVLLANMILCYIDLHIIRGYAPQFVLSATWSLIFWGVIIPVYLYKRAKALNQSLAYFVVWIIAFALPFVPIIFSLIS